MATRTRKLIFDAPDGSQIESERPMYFTPAGEANYDAPKSGSSQEQLDYWNEVLRSSDDPKQRDEALSAIDQALNNLYKPVDALPDLTTEAGRAQASAAAGARLGDVGRQLNELQTAYALAGPIDNWPEPDRSKGKRLAQQFEYDSRYLEKLNAGENPGPALYNNTDGVPGNGTSSGGSTGSDPGTFQTGYPSISSLMDAAKGIGGAKSSMYGSTVLPAFDSLKGALGNSTDTYSKAATSMAQSGDVYKTALQSILDQAYANSDSANTADRSALNNFMGETNALMGMRQGAGWGSDVASKTAGTFADANDVATQMEALDLLRQEARTGGADQRDALGQLKREASEGGALQRDVYNKFAALTDPTITAKERAVFDATQQASDARQRSNREAVMDELTRRGLRTGAGVIANMQAGAQQDSSSRNQALLGLDAMAIDRAMQALAGSGTAANALRNSDQTALARVFDAASGIRSADQASQARFYDAASGTRQQGWNEALARSSAADAMAQFNKSGSQTAAQWQDKVAMDEAGRVGNLAATRFNANTGVNNTAYGRTNDTLNRGTVTAGQAYNTDKDTATWDIQAADKGVTNAATGYDAANSTTKGMSDIWDATFDKVNNLIRDSKAEDLEKEQLKYGNRS